MYFRIIPKCFFHFDHCETLGYNEDETEGNRPTKTTFVCQAYIKPLIQINSHF